MVESENNENILINNKFNIPENICSSTDETMNGTDSINDFAKSYVDKLVLFNFDLDLIYTDQTKEKATKKMVQDILMGDELIKGNLSCLEV